MEGVSGPMRVTHVSGAGAAFAAQNAARQGGSVVAPVKQGFLHKRGNKPYLKNLKLRWFVLEDNTLTYHKKPGMPSLGTIPMAEVTSVAPADSATDPFLFALVHDRADSQRIYYLRARSLPEMEEWMDALRRSSAYHSTSSSPAVALAAASALKAALASASSSAPASSAPLPSPRGLAAQATVAGGAGPGVSYSPSSTAGTFSLSSASSSTSSSPSNSDRYSPTLRDSELLQRYQAREQELERAFRETKEALGAEKLKALFVLEKEQKNIKQLQQERNSLKAQMQRLEQLLAEREQQIQEVVSDTDDGSSGVRYSLGRDEEVKRLRGEMREKQEAFDAMKKEMDAYAKMQSLFEQAGDSADPAQAIEIMKLQMAEMRELLEGKVHDLQSKLADEKKKTDTDVAQWKSMAQKELKTRLQLESEKAALQKELQEVKRQSQTLSAGRLEQMELEDGHTAPGSRRSVGKWSSTTGTGAIREPLLDDGEPEGDGDVSIWTPNRSRLAKHQASSTCFNCTLQ